MSLSRIHRRRLDYYKLDITPIQLSLSNTSAATNGVIYASNNLVYIIPFSSNQIIEYDPITNNVNYYGNFSGGAKFSDVIEVSGKLYIGCQFYGKIVEFDITTKAIVEIGSGIGVYNQLIHQGNYIYALKGNATQWLRMDLTTKVITYHGTVEVGNTKYIGGHINNDNDIVAVGFQQTNKLNVFDTTLLTDTFILNPYPITTVRYYYRGVKIGDNHYYVPNDSVLANMLIVNHTTNAVSFTSSEFSLDTCSQPYRIDDDNILIQQRNGQLTTYTISTDSFKVLGIVADGIQKGAYIGDSTYVFAPLVGDKLYKVKI